MESAGTASPRWLVAAGDRLPAPGAWLSAAEAETADGLRSGKRRREYLLRRWTCKQAVAAHLDLPAGLPSLARVHVGNHPDGAPDVRVDGSPLADDVSLSDRAGWAVCLIGVGPDPVGCDIELVEPRSSAFLEDFLTPVERAFVASRPTEDQPAAATLVWSAKESALKMLRTGLRADTRSVEVHASTPAGHPGRAGSGWWPLEVRSADGRRYGGWWRRDGDFLLTVTTRTTLGQPRPLAGSRDLAAARPLPSWTGPPQAP